MTIELLVAFTTSLLEYQNLVSLYMIQDGSLYAGSVHIGSTHFDRTVVIGQKHFAEIKRSTLLALKTVYEDLLPFLNLELTAVSGYYTFK